MVQTDDIEVELQPRDEHTEQTEHHEHRAIWRSQGSNKLIIFTQQDDDGKYCKRYWWRANGLLLRGLYWNKRSALVDQAEST